MTEMYEAWAFYRDPAWPSLNQWRLLGMFAELAQAQQRIRDFDPDCPNRVLRVNRTEVVMPPNRH